MKQRAMVVVLSVALGAGAVAGCKGAPAPSLTTEELMDPQKCASCHPIHFAEWSGSMHAYASDDPVFVAMNARMQRETNGTDPSFCVKCHAPMALQQGATKDGTNLASVDAKLHGVTCYFCHSVDAVNGTHNNPLSLATDGVMRASIKDPTPNTAHAAGYQGLLDRDDASSANLCGSCHDIDNALGTHLERTFAEWKGTLFSHGTLELTCGECHMDGTPGAAAQYPGVPQRRVHSHKLEGIDVALTPFPQAAEQQTAVQTLLDSSLQAALCVTGLPGQVSIQVVLDNVGAGHSWPSGATQDRRAWVEVQAFDASGQVVYQSGVVPGGTSVTSLNDPDLWLVRDCIFDAQGKEVNMFWQAASHDSNQLPGPTTSVPTDPAFYLTHVMRTYPRAPQYLAAIPDHVTMKVSIIPVGLDVLDDLIASGDLDPAVKAKMTALSLGPTTLTWTPATAKIMYPGGGGLVVSCVASGLKNGGYGANPAPEHTMCKP